MRRIIGGDVLLNLVSAVHHRSRPRRERKITSSTLHGIIMNASDVKLWDMPYAITLSLSRFMYCDYLVGLSSANTS